MMLELMDRLVLHKMEVLLPLYAGSLPELVACNVCYMI